MNKEEFRSKVYGCWMGKNIGGTLGMPMEWERCKNDITYYCLLYTSDAADE